MRIYVDFDDVICETAKFFSGFVKELFDIDCPYENIRYFDLKKSFSLTEEQYSRMMELAHEDKYIEGYEEVPGAVEVLDRWRKAGHEVVVVTGRPFHTAESSRRWLEAHGLGGTTMIFVDKYSRHESAPGTEKNTVKVEDLKKMHFDLAVEDSPSGLEHLRGMDCTVAVYSRPWNKDCRGDFPQNKFRWCNDWHVVDELLSTVQPGCAESH